jgi:hypothetical protein
MLEILLIIMLAKKIGAIVADKGYSRFPFQLMLVALWVGGEIVGGVIGYVVAAASSGRGDEPTFFVYLFALGGAAAGAIISFVIANSLRAQKTDEDFYRGRPEAVDWPAIDRSKFGEPRRPSGEGYTDRPDSPPTHPDDRIQS